MHIINYISEFHQQLSLPEPLHPLVSIRFYERQFITRKAVNNDLLSKMEQLLDEWLNKLS